jgi:hypothetical protein
MYGGQSVAGGSAGAAGAAGASGHGLDILPFTGMAPLELAIAGFVLVAAGQAIARMVPRRSGDRG